ncbi:zinc-finger of the MIZ type in Nse subunit-domain-containing protein [Daldinia decipiens]|uniref:zinc-finger of the MIZ type in Nse subunit-domain-containing protein n=1 Tax=Daldinia decipiens TaxID=326647 RepID=UPI0020C3EDCA|nr:zinc-finger of the MIZ type in Nse subunit-domain-containing protein [Daldinia decipiens]KAI1656358.1 zinc-finger of the MIZ type in Nse subunit-domain-containing protein [Daldinia decipiens]
MPLLSGSRRLQSAAEHNRGRPSTSSSRIQRDNGPVELPEYEPLACPLSAEAIRALTQLSTSKDMRKYEEQLNKSIELLSASVQNINDKYEERKESLKNLQEKRAGRDEKNDRERAEEKAVLALKNDVPMLTNECNLAVQSVIDLKIELEDSNLALRGTAQKVEAEATNAARRQRHQDDDDDEMADANITSPIMLLQRAKERAAEEYASKTPYERYGTNNDYVGFKRFWHDAVYGRGNKPLPDASKWFSHNGGEDEASEDEDLIVAEEHLDIHCPLSMVVMKDPYTSIKCKHTFEKDSIIQFLQTQRGRARCPQTGCNKEVSVSDFHPDPVMLRRIKRQLASQRASMADDDEDEDEDGEGDDGEGESEQDVDVEGDSRMSATPGRNIKSEREGRSRGQQLIDDLIQ